MAQTDHAPVETRFAAPPGFPAVPHVKAPAGIEQGVRPAVVGVAQSQDLAAKPGRRQFHFLVRVNAGPVHSWAAQHTKARDAAVGMEVQTNVGGMAWGRQGEAVQMVALQSGHGQQGLPASGSRILAIAEDAGVHGGGHGVVAGEVSGIDFQLVDVTGGAQAHDCTVVSGAAAAAGFPAIHPLAVIIEFVGDESRGRLRQHAFGAGEELVGNRYDLGAQPGGGEIRVGDDGVRH